MADQQLAHWLATLPDEWTRGIDRSIVERAYAAYRSPVRHYHTWDHVVACVELLRTVPCERPQVVFLALVFHDAVYVAGRSDNEARSAQLAREMLDENPSVTAADLTEIHDLILATKDHHARMGVAGADQATLLDIDLSILARPRDEYMRYAQQIRDEWVPAVVSEAEYRIGRIAFLGRMLAAPHVYLSPSRQEQWDDAARANMTWELETLQARPQFKK